MKRKYIRDQHWVKFPLLVSEAWCLQGFRDAQTHKLTHGWTSPKTSTSPIIFGGGGTKNPRRLCN